MIDLLAFCKSGEFENIKLGQTKEWILANFTEPDSIWDNQYGQSIWTYGDIEFHFDNEELIFIFSDNFSRKALSTGENLEINPWIFEKPKTLKLKKVMEILNTENIDFIKQTTSISIILKLKSGVEFTFENEKDIPNLNPNQYILSAFCLKI
ncbi:hypothetical protein CGC48_02330 [Capnocytophaga cynodegmi]|uniref:Uncharacterized protein n=1 Tax=Capnocytophaga cynodegmi TaxID=28189 RepID=A0A286NTW8_9FLAO|nr:hypothetical protein [Capnocytophaga cynodegmi]ATA67569.1 hypothetical protein CGC48_02330 [Capnocytophaga cynodegmi]